MKKGISILLLAFCLLFSMSGCSGETYKAFTFSVETGDKVRVELNTTGGYDLTSSLPFEISQDGVTLSQGIFIEADKFESYSEAANTDAQAKVIESDTKGKNQYIFWSYNDSEFNIAILIGDSNTGILLGNSTSEESARECFNRLSISIDE